MSICLGFITYVREYEWDYQRLSKTDVKSKSNQNRTMDIISLAAINFQKLYWMGRKSSLDIKKLFFSFFLLYFLSIFCIFGKLKMYLILECLGFNDNVFFVEYNRVYANSPYMYFLLIVFTFIRNVNKGIGLKDN